jgi:hypothetical protein
MTRVLPISISAEPSALARKFGVILTARNSSTARLSVRVKVMILNPQISQIYPF